MVKADRVNPLGINGGFSAPYRSRNPTLMLHGVVESAHFSLAASKRRWVQPSRAGFMGRVGH